MTEGGEWTSFDKVYNDEEADFMANLFSSSSFSDDLEMSSLVSSESNLYSLSLGSNLSIGSENYCLSDPDQFFAVNDSSLPSEFYSKEINHSLPTGISEILPTEEDKSIVSSEVGAKRCRSSEVEKGKRNTRVKRNRKTVCDDEDNSGVLNSQTSGSCITSEEFSGEKPTKTRASRGSATDPQSLYARKRRGRINERLRILQNLVPNGTKVDLSTMLEEAVYYVKFLQLQIKLLSSDDLWMYAPLAYNGMDAGLEAKINSLL